MEPRFLFAFSAHKAHLSFATTAAAMEAFRTLLDDHETTKQTLEIRYNQELPWVLVRDLAEHCLRAVGDREDNGFW